MVLIHHRCVSLSVFFISANSEFTIPSQRPLLPQRAASLPSMVNASSGCQQVTGIYKKENHFMYLIPAWANPEDSETWTGIKGGRCEFYLNIEQLWAVLSLAISDLLREYSPPFWNYLSSSLVSSLTKRNSSYCRALNDTESMSSAQVLFHTSTWQSKEMEISFLWSHQILILFEGYNIQFCDFTVEF